MDLGVVEQIDAMLDRIEADGVRILWAAESGSRAWGFPSPDSDYDVRFLYVRPASDYLSLRPHRDVIEHPVDETFDVNGWDVRKALRLLVKGNAAAGEWLRSPITYRGDAAARDLLLDTAAQVMPFDGLLGHHFHVATNNLDLVRRTGRAKKFLYALREAVTCRWLLAHGPGQVPPMDLPTLLAESDASAEVAEAAGVLVDAKRHLVEGAGLPVALTPVLYDFVTQQLATIADYREQHPQAYDPEVAEATWKAVDETFLNLTKTEG